MKWGKKVTPAWGTGWWNLGDLTVILISAFVFFRGKSKEVPWTSKHFFTITQEDIFTWAFEQRDHDETHVLEKKPRDFILLCLVIYLPVLQSTDLLCCEGSTMEIHPFSLLHVHHLCSSLCLFIACWPVGAQVWWGNWMNRERVTLWWFFGRQFPACRAWENNMKGHLCVS